MPQPVTDQIQYWSFELTLTKEFLKRTHAHKLLTPIKDADESLHDQMWTNTPDITSFRFGGLYGTQFTTVDQVSEFNAAFNDLLERKNIPKRHKDPLLYLASFAEQDFELQSIERNTINRLKDYADFITDLYSAGSRHFERMTNHKEYVMLQDPFTLEYFFAKKTLVDHMSLSEIAEYLPDAKNADDIIRYIRIKIGLNEIYVPKDLNPALHSLSQLRSTSGEKIDSIKFPRQFKDVLLKFTVADMMEDHKRSNTKFYQLFQEEELDMVELKKLYKSNRKHKFRNVRVLCRIGTIVGDYLKTEKLAKFKKDIADFLWEYFMLIRLYEVPTKLPERYSDLKKFYIKNDITAESIRLMMKDAGKFGDF